MFRIFSYLSVRRINSYDLVKHSSSKISQIKNSYSRPHTLFCGVKAWYMGIQHLRVNAYKALYSSCHEIQSTPSKIEGLKSSQNSLALITYSNVHSALVLKGEDDTYTFISIYKNKSIYMENINFERLSTLISDEETSFNYKLTDEDVVCIHNLDLSNSLSSIKCAIENNKYHFLTHNCSKFTSNILTSFIDNRIKFTHDRIFQMPLNTKELAKEINFHIENKDTYTSQFLL